MDHKVLPWAVLIQECSHFEVVGDPTWVVECAVEEVAIRWDPEDQMVVLGIDPMDLTPWATAGKVVVVVVVEVEVVVEVSCGR
jgi:hypothetical protein